jgi:hypothetical protein
MSTAERGAALEFVVGGIELLFELPHPAADNNNKEIINTQ